MTIAKAIIANLPENFNWQSIYMENFIKALVYLYQKNNYPTDIPPTIAIYPGNHHCIELYDGSALAFFTDKDLDISDCKVFWIKAFESYTDAKNYIAPLAGASHNDSVREFYTQTRH